MEGLTGSSVKDLFSSNIFGSGKSSVLVRFTVVALLLGLMVGGASAITMKFDDFEDGDYTSDPAWNRIDSGGSAQVQSQTVLKGSETLELTSPDGDKSDNTLRYQRSDGTIDDGDVYQAWIRGDPVPEFISRLEIYNSGRDDAVGIAFDGSGIALSTRDSSATLISSTNAYSSVQDNTAYFTEIVFYPSSSEANLKVYDSNKNFLGESGNVSTSGATSLEYVRLNLNPDSNAYSLFFDDVSYSSEPINRPPEFNSTSIDPDPPFIGENVSYSAEVYDSDGSVQYTNLSLSYGGSTVLSDEQRTGTTPEWNNIYTPQDGNKWLNATLEVVDDSGAVTTTSIDRYLSDNPPNIQINDPQAQDYFTYDVPLEVEASDSDSRPDEVYSCTVDKNTSQSTVASFDLYENGSTSYSDTVRSDLGSHNLTVSCSDDAGNTDSVSQTYSVKDFEFTGLSGSSNAFETVKETFSSDETVGAMVNNVTYDLVYSGETVGTKEVDYSGQTSDTQIFSHEIPLVNSDGTNKDYSVEASVSYEGINGANKTASFSTGNSTQTVDQAYKFGNHSLEDGFTQLEASDLEYTATVDEKTSNAQGIITGETEFKQTDTVKSLSQGTGFNYSNTFESGFVSSSSESFDLVTDFTLEFNGDSRTFTGTKAVTLERIDLSTSSSNGDEALRLETKNEVNDSSIDSDVQLGVNLANPDRPDKTRFFGFDVGGSSSHSFYLSPSDAEVIANARSEENIVYQDTDEDFAQRRHFLIDERLNNQTTIVNLYLLSLSDSASVTLELIDSDFNAVSGHVVRVERNFPNLNSSKIVDMTLTGSEGKGNIKVDPEEQYIFTVFDENGDLVEQIGPQQITSNQVQLQLSEESEPNLAELVNGLQVSDVALSTTEASLDYVSETEKLNNISLIVKKNSVFDDTVVAEDSSTDLQGRLKASGFNSTESELFYEVKVRFGDTSEIIDTGRFGSNNGKYGDVGIFFSILMFVTVTFAGLWKPEAAIALGAVSLIILSPVMLGFIPLTGSSLIAVVALAALLVWRMSS